MKKLQLALVAILLLSCNAIIAETFKTQSFDAAKKESQYLKFTGTSTKFGFVSTDFDGYAKEFSIETTIGKKENQPQLIKAKIDIVATSLDTDNSSRNEKLHTKCLNAEIYKNITAELIEPVLLNESTDQKANLKLTVRDTTMTIPSIYSIKKIENGFEIEFTTQFSFKEAHIPDPSIAIAKVEDLIKLSGKIRIKR